MAIRAGPWLAMPAIGVLLGLALATKWVAAYAIGALALLILVRSALGRVVAILGLIGITSVLGYIAIAVPEGEGGVGNLTFLLIMVGLTLTAVVAAVTHPIAWTDAEQWFALIAPAAAGTVVFFGAIATGRIDTAYTLGPIAVTPLLLAIALSMGSLVVAGAFTLGGRVGYGPFATPPPPTTHVPSCRRRTRRRRTGCARAGWPGCPCCSPRSASSPSHSSSTS